MPAEAGDLKFKPTFTIVRSVAEVVAVSESDDEGTSATAQSDAPSQPPPAAWGASPPWRYDERPDEVLGAMAETLARTLIQQALPVEHAALRPYAPVLGLAAAVLFLRQAEGPAAGDQLMLMEQRARGLPGLPSVVAAMASQPRLAASEAMLHVLSH